MISSFLHHNPVIIIFVIFGGLLLVVGLLGIVHRTKLSLWGEPRFYVYEGGLVIADRKSVKAVVRLNDVDSIQQMLFLEAKAWRL